MVLSQNNLARSNEMSFAKYLTCTFAPVYIKYKNSENIDVNTLAQVTPDEVVWPTVAVLGLC